MTKFDSYRLYSLLPTWLRSTAATLRGVQLAWWRYGSNTDRLVREAWERETWSEEQWNHFQEERLAFFLHRAAKSVPFYRMHWEYRRRKGDRLSWDRLENWPVLKKEELRQNQRAFLAEGCNPFWMFADHSSGTTGTPLTIWQSRATVQAWYALFEARWRGWYGVNRFTRWGILGGQLVSPIDQNRPPYWVWNQGLNQLYLSSYHLKPDTVHDYLQAISRYGVKYLWGYASSLDTLGSYMLSQGLNSPPLQFVISNAEPLYQHQRQRISQAFDCPVYDTYGMTETVCAASECKQGRLHLWPEAGVLEVLNDNSEAPVQPGETGRLVSTGLLNADMPLIRYEIGDRGILEPNGNKCICGRTLPLLCSVEGRQDDAIITEDGRRIGRLDPVFKADFPIREAQIIQESMQDIQVLVVPADGYSEATGQEIIDRLYSRVGKFKIRVEMVEAIPRGTNGKFKAVISRVTSHD